MNEMNESRTELFSRVQTLKKVRRLAGWLRHSAIRFLSNTEISFHTEINKWNKLASDLILLAVGQDVKDWRGMLNTQVKSYREVS